MSPIVKRVLVGFVGGLITLIGVVALVAPGPGWLIIFTGLGILASEFAWAARVLTSAKGVASRAADAAKIQKKAPTPYFCRSIFSLPFILSYLVRIPTLIARLLPPLC